MDSSNTKQKIVVVCGPTGSGKTSVAIELANTFSGEIVGADSMQIYRYMNIGTAKPTPEEQSRVPHHMIDIVDPDEHFDAAMYEGMAGKIIGTLHTRELLPFVVGGTGFYIKSLVYGLFQGRSIDGSIRRRLKDEAVARGFGYLYERLEECDPESAQRIHPNDNYRILRALEVFEATGKTISQYQRGHKFAEPSYAVLKIGLHMDRNILYDRINRRVDAMIEAGFVKEVSDLLDMGYAPELKSMQSIGYRHVVDFLQTRLSWDEMLRTMQRDTRRYAKRQLTWFGNDKDIIWIEPERQADIRMQIKKFLL
ncbi:tRNA (adenosine(37)-N6)-dimethylallyltransferase MiaA [Thermodesulfobacteriota bacterium]